MNEVKMAVNAIATPAESPPVNQPLQEEKLT